MLRYISLIMKKILKKTNKKVLDQGRQLKEKKEKRKQKVLESRILGIKKEKEKKKEKKNSFKVPAGSTQAVRNVKHTSKINKTSIV